VFGNGFLSLEKVDLANLRPTHLLYMIFAGNKAFTADSELAQAGTLSKNAESSATAHMAEFDHEAKKSPGQGRGGGPD
jgi:hypothetical protein